MPVYPMVRRPRGQALIIDIETYENDVQVQQTTAGCGQIMINKWSLQERRLGTDVDVDNLVALLKVCPSYWSKQHSFHVHIAHAQGLEFEVRVHRDLALGPFYREVTEFCSSKLHSEADMAIVVILSHGQVEGGAVNNPLRSFHSAPTWALFKAQEGIS